MRVFEVAPDFQFQTFYSSDPNTQEFSEMEYTKYLGTCASVLPSWTPLRLFAEADLKKSDRRKRGNFARSWGGGFIIDATAYDVLRPVLENTCELLPFLPYNGEVLHVMNLLGCVDCLDEERTMRSIDKASGMKLVQIEKYYFVPERVPESIPFKLPKRSSVFTAVGPGNPEFEFKSIVEREGLTGLKFKELWSDDK